MTKSRQSRQNPEVREFILRNVGKHPDSIVALAVEKFGLTRTTIHRYVVRLQEEGLLIAHGRTRARRLEKPCDKDALSNKKKRSKNAINIDQINIACRHVDELLEVGVTENLAIRTLELLMDVFAKLHKGGSATPHSADQVDLWSIKAKKALKNNPGVKPGKIVRVEHGTPKRAFARLGLGLFHSNQLNEEQLVGLVDKYWKLAVITLEEDKRLNKIFKSTMLNTPDDRWALAGIKFP